MPSPTRTETTVREPRRTTRTVRWHLIVAALVALLLPVSAIALVTAPAALAAVPGPVTFTSGAGPSGPPCPAGRYVVPAGVRLVQVTATGGGGADGGSVGSPGYHTGGLGGTGAQVTASLPVTPGQTLTVVAGRPGSNNDVDAFSGWPNGGQNSYQRGDGGGSSYVTTQALVASTGCKDIADFRLDRAKMLLVAGGGGGGGSASNFGGGGYGGSAGVGGTLDGANGRDAYHLSSDCGYGHGGGGASTTAAGAGGSAACLGDPGSGGAGFNGGEYLPTVNNSYQGRGAGGGGWYGGGSGSDGKLLGGGGGGAGSSYVTPTARSWSVTQAKTGPAVIVTPVLAPVTTLTIDGSAPVERYTGTVTVAITAEPTGASPVEYISANVDEVSCSIDAYTCRRYTGPIQLGPGLHNVTYFAVNSQGVDEPQRTVTFYVAPEGSTPVTSSALASGTDVTATAGGTAGTAGTVTVTANGSGSVGAAVYGSNPAGATTFDSTGAFAQASIANNFRGTLTITDCHLEGGTLLHYWTGTSWDLITGPDGTSAQTYDAATRCVTVTLDRFSTPKLGTMDVLLAAGRAPTTTFTSDAPSAAVVGDTYTPVATASSGLPVTFGTSGACSLTDGVVTFTGAGTCSVTATQPGSTTVPAAVPAVQAITVAPAPQTVSPTSTAPTEAAPGGSYTPTATSSSGLPVTFTASGACVITDGVVSFTGTGTCTLTGTQAGDADHAPAQFVQTITVAQPNRAPTAAADTFTTAAAAPALSVPAPGVLGNDGDPDAGDGLTATVTTRPTNGTVALAGDGSFTYTPRAGFTGADTFTYQAVDRSGARSAATTVTITVARADAQLAVSLTAPSTAGRGTSFPVTVTVTNKGPSTATLVGTTVTLSRGLTITGGRGLVSRDRQSVGFAELSLRPGASLSYTVTVTADRSPGNRTVAAGTASLTRDSVLGDNTAQRTTKVG